MDLAAAFGVTSSTIAQIKMGLIYRDRPRPKLRCDFCTRPESDEPPKLKVRPFSLIVADARSKRTTRGAGTIILCDRCWRETAGKRTRRALLLARAEARRRPIGTVAA